MLHQPSAYEKVEKVIGTALVGISKKRRRRSRAAGDAPDVVDVHVGSQIKARRIVLGISQSGIAKALEMSFQQIQKYETGFNRISASRLFQIAMFLKVPVSYFFEGLMPFSAPENEPQQSRMKLETSKLLGSLNTRDLKIAHKLVLELSRAV